MRWLIRSIQIGKCERTYEQFHTRILSFIMVIHLNALILYKYMNSRVWCAYVDIIVVYSFCMDSIILLMHAVCTKRFTACLDAFCVCAPRSMGG